MILILTAIIGQNCHVPVRSSYSAPYVAPVVSAPYVTPTYNTATISYGHQYNFETYTPYVSNSILAYRVSNPDLESAQRLNEQLAAGNKVAIEALSAQLLSLKSAPIAPAVQGQGSPAPPAPPDVPQPRAQAANTSAPAILQAACAKCHGGAKASGGFLLSLGKDGSASIATRALVYDVVSQGEMPPKAERQLNEAEKKAIAEWAAASREELKAATKTVASK